MRIGLISINMYTKGLNFACPLHTYAFQQFLLKHGIESTVIDYQPIYYGNFDLKHPYEFYRALCERRLAENNLEGLDELIEKRDGYQALYKEREVRYDKFQSFIEKNYLKTDKVYTSDLLEVNDPGFDCYICVTDVIWKNEQPHGFDRGFFLGSAPMKNKWKIAYAASRGVYLAESEEDERRFLHYIDDLDFIGVREASLQQYIQNASDKNVSLVLDPVLLHDRSFYDELAVKPPEEDYLFLYYVMEQAADTLDQAVAYARAHHLKIVEVTDRPLPQGRLSEYDDLDVTYRYDIGIEEWLGYFKHARVVFTNSFHATCFSILFEKEFFVGKRAGDKVSNALETFGLSHRRFSRTTDMSGEPLDPIDYGKVKGILEEKRAESAAFILDAIKYAESHERPASNYEWWEREQRYPLTYTSGKHDGLIVAALTDDLDVVTQNADGSMSYQRRCIYGNDGLSRLAQEKFFRPGFSVKGWHLRFKIDNRYFWYLDNGTFVPVRDWSEEESGARRLFAPRERLPYIPVDRISNMIAEAQWEREEDTHKVEIIFNSGAKNCAIGTMPEEASRVKLPSGSLECRLQDTWQNSGCYDLPADSFLREGFYLSGWRVRLKINDLWYWLLEDGSLMPLRIWNELPVKPKRREIAVGTSIPVIANDAISLVAVEAIWKRPASEMTFAKRAKRYLRRRLSRS